MSGIIVTSLISVCVPVLNEETNIGEAYRRIRDVFDNLPEYDFEMIVTDNHSTDATFEIATGLAREDARVRVCRFSKNVGFQKSILTGYLLARGEAAIQLDCDMQDPPEFIPRMLELWREGNEVVYGVRNKRQEGWFITSMRKLFYVAVDKLSEERLPQDAGDFRLIDRKIIDVLREIGDNSPYLRGTIASIGFNQVGFRYDRDARSSGESKFRTNALIRLATDAIVAHSIVPLQIATYIGFFFAASGALFLIVYLVAKLVAGADWPPGFVTLVLLILLNLSLTGLLFGVFGEYVGRILRQVREQPLSIIEKSVGIGKIAESPAIRILDMSAPQEAQATIAPITRKKKASPNRKLTK